MFHFKNITKKNKIFSNRKKPFHRIYSILSTCHIFNYVIHKKKAFYEVLRPVADVRDLRKFMTTEKNVSTKVLI